MSFSISKRIHRLKKSLARRLAEASLPKGYKKLGTRYGGWWIDTAIIGEDSLLIDCGLGEDISFPILFLGKFGGRVIGIEANPKSIRYCENRLPEKMLLLHRAFWINAGEIIDFFLPESPDFVSGSLLSNHKYAGSDRISVMTTNLDQVLALGGREECDVLKMDIEGAEYEVLNELCSSGKIRKTKQLLVEYHYFCTGYSDEDTFKSIRAVEENGFKLIYVEGRNYIFRRVEL